MGSITPFQTRKQVLTRYGNPYLDPVHWPIKWIVKLVLNSGKPKPYTVWCNRDIATQLSNVWHDLELHGLLQYINSVDGCYVLRNKRSDPNSISMHGFGLAIDLNAKTNRMGTRGNMNPSIILSFKKFGWDWGGDWHTPDPMHFEWSIGGI
jgi:hypothetical protein